MVRALSTAAICLFLAGCGGVSQAHVTEQGSSSVVPKLKPLRDAQASSAAWVVLPPISSDSSASSASSDSSRAMLEIPPAAQLDVPFTSQAPHKNWNEPYQNACEETSLLTVMHYLEDRPFTPESADREILDFTAKTASMGYGPSITMQQLADISSALYPQYTPVLHTDVSIESLQKLIAQGKPVIIPAAGKQLNNPYFSGGGPWYHMLVVTGYDQSYFYTNDVGTGHGERYAYPHDLLVNSIHDWTGVDERIAEGRKVMMTLETR
jgi:uncharacterized protein YvpB